MRFLLYSFLVVLSLPLWSQPKQEFYDARQSQLKSETDYYKGMAHGTHTEFYKSGNISRKGIYRYGEEDSLWVFYYEDGAKKAVERYHRGKKNGTNRYYFKNGT